MAVWLDGIGVSAPGMVGWAEARSVLGGARAYGAEPMPAPRTTLLAANERRRTTPVIRLALQTAEEATRDCGVAPDQLASVFASSSGDMEIVDRICTALSTPERPVSPTQFHNSVHNAPAGYWSLGAAARNPSTSIAAHDRSFAAGLMEAWTLVEVEQASVLLVVYDWPPPPTLQDHRPLQHPFAVALVLRPTPGSGLPLRLTLSMEPGTIHTMAEPALEALRRDNPAAHALPLLEAIAQGEAASVSVPYTDHNVLTVQCHKA